MQCQFINNHHKSVSEVFNCNTNIQIGDRSQIFYSTLYCGKSTQKEDAECIQGVNTTVHKRFLRVQEQVFSGKINSGEFQG